MDITRETRYTIYCNRCGDTETYDELGGHPTKQLILEERQGAYITILEAAEAALSEMEERE